MGGTHAYCSQQNQKCTMNIIVVCSKNCTNIYGHSRFLRCRFELKLNPEICLSCSDGFCCLALPRVSFHCCLCDLEISQTHASTVIHQHYGTNILNQNDKNSAQQLTNLGIEEKFNVLTQK